ncbi:Gx transporter family protein [Faecalimonas sp.]
MKNSKAYFGMLTALALIFSYVELIIPFHIGIPGVKLGLANLVIVISMYKMKKPQVYLLSITRVILAGFMFGNLFSIIYSLAGSLLSLFVMYMLKGNGKFSILGISMAGGVFHNIGQLIIAIIVLQSLNLIYYASVLLISGVITGIIIGIISSEVIKRIQKICL